MLAVEWRGDEAGSESSVSASSTNPRGDCGGTQAVLEVWKKVEYLSRVLSSRSGVRTLSMSMASHGNDARESRLSIRIDVGLDRRFMLALTSGLLEMNLTRFGAMVRKRLSQLSPELNN